MLEHCFPQRALWRQGCRKETIQSCHKHMVGADAVLTWQWWLRLPAPELDWGQRRQGLGALLAESHRWLATDRWNWEEPHKLSFPMAVISPPETFKLPAGERGKTGCSIPDLWLKALTQAVQTAVRPPTWCSGITAVLSFPRQRSSLWTDRISALQNG